MSSEKSLHSATAEKVLNLSKHGCSIYRTKGIQKKYKYMWYLRERCWCEEKTLKLMHKAVCEEHDLVFMDVGHPESKVELSICNDANEFYHCCGDYATSMDTVIYNIDKMLEDNFNIEKFYPQYDFEYRVTFLFVFEQLSKIEKPDICLLAGNNVAIHHSALGHSSWGIVGLKYGENVGSERISNFLNAMMVEKK